MGLDPDLNFSSKSSVPDKEIDISYEQYGNFDGFEKIQNIDLNQI